jgi:outer membrane biosynthesis protein TonB
MRRLGTWLVAAGAVLALALAACGGSDATPEQAGLPRALAERLASESDAIADKLDAGDECGAAQQADILESAVEEAIAAGQIPDEFQAELLENAQQLQNDVNCPQPPPPPDECAQLEEQKQALEEQKEDAEDEEKELLEEQIKALDEQIKEACGNGNGNGNGKGKGKNGDGGDD